MKVVHKEYMVSQAIITTHKSKCHKRIVNIIIAKCKRNIWLATTEKH